MNVFHYGLGKFNNEQLDEFINFINQIGNSPNLHLKIYLNSVGGFEQVKSMIVEILNNYSHEIFVTAAESAAFDFIYECNGEVKFHPECYAMYHFGEINIEYLDGMFEQPITKMKVEVSKLGLKKTKALMNDLGFTELEKESVLNGRDVYFGYDRLIELFDYKLIK